MKLSFLTSDQLFCSNELDIIKKRGTKAAISDFAILLGGYVSDYHYASSGTYLKDRTGWYWTKTDDGSNDARVVSRSGYERTLYVNGRHLGARPALPYSFISDISTNRVIGRAKDGVLEVEYGYYPDKAASVDVQRRLEYAYENGQISRTGNSYTTDSRKYNDYDSGFHSQTHTEYEFEGKRYVRVTANSYFDGNEFELSNGKKYRDGDVVWVEVNPVKWLVDEKEQIMITEKLIFAGVQFNRVRNYKGGFHKTDIYRFMDNYLSKELFQTRTITQTNTQKQNAYSNNNYEEFKKIIKTMAYKNKITLACNLLQEDEEKTRIVKSFIRDLDDDLAAIFNELSKSQNNPNKIFSKKK